MSYRLTLIAMVIGISTESATVTVAQTIRAAAEAPAFAAPTRFPWYDVNAHRLQPILETEDLPLPGSPGWVVKRQPSPPTGSSRFWEAISQILQYGAWLTLAGFLFWLALYLVKAVMRDAPAPSPDSSSETHRRQHEVDSIEQLPFQVQRPVQDLLGEAVHCYQAQDYRAAIVYLYSYQLVQLDRHQCIHLAKGKTNRQYLSELASAPALRRMLTTTMLAFEDVYFGHYPLARERFENCWTQLDDFHQLMQQHSTPTRG